MNYLKNPFVLYGIIIILFLLNVGGVFYIFYFQEKNSSCNDEVGIVASNENLENENTEEENKTLFVDIKGYIKNPGVYEMEEGSIVNDLIKKAGGIKKNGTTENINLSKKLVDETMIVISSKYELRKKLEENVINNDSSSVNENNTPTSSIYEETKTYENNSTVDDKNKKISLNNATKEELMTLSGIGEKTAEKIIEYRNTKKFTTIEDLKNVSGIGDSTFEKIKDNITI